MAWQDMNTAPKDGTWVLLTGSTAANSPPAVVAYWHSQEYNWMTSFWDNGTGTAYQDPKFWTALELPEEVAEQPVMEPQEQESAVKPATEQPADVKPVA